MNRTEALEEFNKDIDAELIDKYKLKFEKNLKEEDEKFGKLLFQSIKDLNKEILKNRKIITNYKAGVLHFELLRTNVLDDSYIIWLHGYNSLWYLDENSVHVEIDLKFLFEPFIEMKKELMSKIKVYMGKVTKYDVQNIIFKITSECFNKLSFVAREYFWDLDEEEWINEIELEDYYIIKWGEYREKSETVFAMDYRCKSKEELESLIKSDKNKMPFLYTVWRNGKYEDCDLSKQSLLFINFKESTLKKINFDESDIISGELKKTVIKECTFDNSRVVGTAFSESILKECKFNNSDLRSSDFRIAKIDDVSFQGSNLTMTNFDCAEIYNVSFKDCLLNKANLTNCIFENVDFEGADLREAIFSRDVIPFIHLSPEQLQDIYIEGGEE